MQTNSNQQTVNRVSHPSSNNPIWRTGHKWLMLDAFTAQSGTNQVNHLRVIRVREGREEAGGEEGREDKDMEYRTKYGLHDKTIKINIQSRQIPTKGSCKSIFRDSGQLWIALCESECIIVSCKNKQTNMIRKNVTQFIFVLNVRWPVTKMRLVMFFYVSSRHSQAQSVFFV